MSYLLVNYPVVMFFVAVALLVAVVTGVTCYAVVSKLQRPKTVLRACAHERWLADGMCIVCGCCELVTSSNALCEMCLAGELAQLSNARERSLLEVAADINTKHIHASQLEEESSLERARR